MGSEGVSGVKFFDQSGELLCNVALVGDVFQFVDLLIKCTFSPELTYY